MSLWHQLFQPIPHGFRLMLHRRRRSLRCFFLERWGDPKKRLVKVHLIRDSWAKNDNTDDFRVLVRPRQLAFDVSRYGRLLDSQKVVSHQNGVVEAGELYVCSIKNARIDTRTGILCTDDNALVVESAVDLRRLRRSPTYLDRVPDRARVGKLRGTYSSIHGMWQQNYFHWMIESLPRLYSLKLWGKPLRLLMPTTLSPLQRLTLEACLPENVELDFFDGANTWLQVDEFVFPSFPVTKHFPILPFEYIDYVRGRIFDRFGLRSAAGGGERIYVSRAQARHARPLNEPQLVQLLEEHGFQPYCLENLEFEEQVKLFHRASIVIAPHGAGLSNLIFAGRIKVIELLSRAVTPTFFFLSQIMAQEYFYLFPIELNVRTIPDPFVHNKRYAQLRKADYTVDLDQLDRLIARIDEMG